MFVSVIWDELKVFFLVIIFIFGILSLVGELYVNIDNFWVIVDIVLFFLEVGEWGKFKGIVVDLVRDILDEMMFK